jgi:hypothetical protein
MHLVHREREREREREKVRKREREREKERERDWVRYNKMMFLGSDYFFTGD